MFRNIWQLLIITLPASLVTAIFCNTEPELTLVTALFKGDITDANYMSELGVNLTLLRFGDYWWGVLISIVLLSYAMCLLVVKIDRHMRTGKMSLLPLRGALDIFLSMLLYIVTMIAVYEGSMLVIVGIVYMLRFISNVTTLMVLALTMTFFVWVFLAYIFLLLIVSFPLKYSEKYRFNIAMSYSVRIMAPKKRVIGFAFLYPVCRIAVMALSYVVGPFDYVINALAILFCLTYIPCFAYTQYYDDVGVERRDISPSRHSFGRGKV